MVAVTDAARADQAPLQGAGGPPELSLVIPCYNEETTLPSLHDALVEVLATMSVTWEVILVDDGSGDATRAVAAAFARDDPCWRVLGLSRNFGKEAAMLAGLRAARGQWVLIMDADLQHPPNLIPGMLELGREGWDQIIARRTRKDEHPVRSGLSRLYYRAVNRLTDLRLTDGAGDFRLISRRCVTALVELGESNRFSKGLFAWIGFPTTAIEYENVLSSREDSRWSAKMLFNYALDGVMSFNTRPLRLAIWTGLAVVFLTLVYLGWMLVDYLRTGIQTPGYLTSIGLVSLLGGVQLITLGVIGEYVGRTFQETKRRPVFLLSYDSAGEQASASPGPAPRDIER